MATETIEVTGHIVDSLLLAKILDSILEAGCDYEMADVVIGKTSLDPSSARIVVTGDDDVLGPLLDELQVHGANRVAQVDATLVDADLDGVLPAGFYSTTNLAGVVRLDGTWLPIENPEMDCGTASGPATAWSSAARACACRRRRRPATPTGSSSWRPRCRPRSPRPCS